MRQRQRHLRAVTPPEIVVRRPGPRTVYASVLEACENGDRYDVLAALRRRLATACDLETTSARDLAPLTRQLVAIVAEIEYLDALDDDENVVVNTPDEPFDGSMV